jgi:hypothetical protein
MALNSPGQGIASLTAKAQKAYAGRLDLYLKKGAGESKEQHPIACLKDRVLGCREIVSTEIETICG